MPETSTSGKSRAKPLALKKLGTELINDNSKRSISLRISTSDFGRIRAIGRRLKARESDVFRFLVKIALTEIELLCDSSLERTDLLRIFATHGAQLIGHFNLNARRLDQIINIDAATRTTRIDADDLELLSMSAFPERYLALRLQELTGKPVPAEDALVTLYNYLEVKYLSGRKQGPYRARTRAVSKTTSEGSSKATERTAS